MHIKQKRAGYFIKCTVAAVSILLFAPMVTNAQFVGNPLIPKADGVIIYTNDAKGGHHQVATIASRDSIILLRRQPGMLCTVMDDGTGKASTYQLISTNVPEELMKNTNWVAFNAGIATGAAGGDLAGVYPNPTIADNAVTTTKIKAGTADQVMVTTAEGVVAWVDKSTLSGGASGPFNGSRPITGAYYTGVNPGTDNLAEWIEKVFYPSLGPSASLTASPSGVREMGPAGSTAVTLTWTAGRAAETAAITEILVNSQNVFTTSPAPGASVNGTMNTTAVNNQSNTYMMSVKTADNKTQSASASVSFQWKRYYGFVSLGDDGSGVQPTNAQILALQSEFATGAAVSGKSATPSGSQKLVIAYPASFGGSKITVGVNDSTGAFDKSTVSFTNASGGTVSYVVFVQKDNTAGALTFSVQ